MGQDGGMATAGGSEPDENRPQRFPVPLMHAAATLYYLEDTTQADVAEKLAVSRATVSRLLAAARREGIVRIEVVTPPDDEVEDLQRQTALALGLDAVHLSAVVSRGATGVVLAPALGDAVHQAGLAPGDILLVSSGRTVFEAAQADWPPVPGIIVAPMVGGQNEPQGWYQTNEISRQIALKVGGTPTFIYAPALPGPSLHETLLDDPSTRTAFDLWAQARCAVVGIGAPPLIRDSLPEFVPRATQSLRYAIGDVCSRFFDADGHPVPFPGSERLISTGLDVLQRLPVVIGLASGPAKVPSVLAAARSGYISQLVTDLPTARALVTLAGEQPRSRTSVRPRKRRPARRP